MKLLSDDPETWRNLRRNALDAGWNRIHKQLTNVTAITNHSNQYQSDITARSVYYREHLVKSLAYR
jgi:hypothetical protein